MSEEKDGDVLIISESVYRALGPLEQIAAQALQKVGKIKILYKDLKFRDL